MQLSQEQLDAQILALRNEFNSGLTTVGVQLGAVEKTLTERLSSIKAWGVAALIGGQGLAGVFAHYLPGAPVQTAARVVARLFVS